MGILTREYCIVKKYTRSDFVNCVNVSNKNKDKNLLSQGSESPYKEMNKTDGTFVRGQAFVGNEITIFLWLLMESLHKALLI